jgi:hypothetical protein
VDGGFDRLNHPYCYCSAAWRAASSATIDSSNLVKTGVGFAMGVPGATGRDCHVGVGE